MKTIQSALNIGVDGGKQQLDFCCHESGQHFTVGNDTAGTTQALKQLSLSPTKRLVVEATGRYELALVRDETFWREMKNVA